MKPSAIAALCLAAVAGSGGGGGPTQEAALRAQAARPVTCNAGQDCGLKWGRAIQWAGTHSYRILSSTFSHIQTEESSKNRSKPVFTITRVANPDGGYTIEFDGKCHGWFGCVPTVLEEKASFAQYVMGP